MEDVHSWACLLWTIFEDRHLAEIRDETFLFKFRGSGMKGTTIESRKELAMFSFDVLRSKFGRFMNFLWSWARGAAPRRRDCESRPRACGVALKFMKRAKHVEPVEDLDIVVTADRYPGAGGADPRGAGSGSWRAGDAREALAPLRTIVFV
ncbi:hypothetical protein K438DRAFT_1767456 [Mycena galopus ATCC 62051]|nr:hypothetical protein K438DRAFT_1767456 [Mycena galopus ATCC 62051]